MKRRDVVRALLTPQAGEPPADGAPPPVRVAAGAVRAMGLEIGRLTEEARAAEVLRRRMESGAMVAELPPDLVDPSFVSDRLTRTADPEFRRLVASIRDSGQLVPILVRPHPDAPGRYQIAYGHRRRDAMAELGLPVKAIVRELTDSELVIAQGQENGARRDLSFIERALFAADLQRRGFDRPTLTGALGVHTAEMTRLLAIAASVPEAVVRAIGPAPKAGRLRWRELARDLARPGAAETVRALLDQPSVRALASDRRFAAVIDAVRAHGQPGPEPRVIADARGIPVLRIEPTPGGPRLIVDERAAPGLGDFLIRELQMLVGRYSAGHR